MFATMAVKNRLEITPNAHVDPATKEAIAVRKVILSMHEEKFHDFLTLLTSTEKLTRAGFELAPSVTPIRRSISSVNESLH